MRMGTQEKGLSQYKFQKGKAFLGVPTHLLIHRAPGMWTGLKGGNNQGNQTPAVSITTA